MKTRHRVRNRNAALVAVLRARGYRTAKAFARDYRLSYGYLCGLLQMVRPPLNKRNGAWQAFITKVADALQCDPAKLFPAAPPPALDIQADDVKILLEPERPVDPETAIIARETLSEFHDLLNRVLSPRNHRVIALRFGLYDDRERTLQEIGDMYGLSREQVRQIEHRALERFHHPGVAVLLKRVTGRSTIRKNVVRFYMPYWRRDEIKAAIRAREEAELLAQTDWRKATAHAERLVKHRQQRRMPDAFCSSDSAIRRMCADIQDEIDASRSVLNVITNEEYMRAARQACPAEWPTPAAGSFVMHDNVNLFIASRDVCRLSPLVRDALIFMERRGEVDWYVAKPGYSFSVANDGGHGYVETPRMSGFERFRFQR